MRRDVVLLGSTGSIGRATMEVAAALNGRVRIRALAAGVRWETLAAQAANVRPDAVAIADERHYRQLRDACPAGTRVYAGADGLVELVCQTEANFVVSAIVGAAGLPATFAAVERGLDVGLANKESLVVAGSILAPLAAERGSQLIPVDSEHSAIFQSLHSGKHAEVSRIYLTASGGPFRTWEKSRIENATLEAALKHPTWSMGPKITIDSATMMNKALEIIEARHLFNLAPEQIEVLIHPESIVHSMVEYCDGSVIAQLGAPDMKTPIQYALTYPARAPGIAQTLRWDQARTLHFEPPDLERFPSLRIGAEVARKGGNSGAVFNAANEAAVELFRAGKIRFGQIVELVGDVLRRARFAPNPSLSELIEDDGWARRETMACC